MQRHVLRDLGPYRLHGFHLVEELFLALKEFRPDPALVRYVESCEICRCLFPPVQRERFVPFVHWVKANSGTRLQVRRGCSCAYQAKRSTFTETVPP